VDPSEDSSGRSLAGARRRIAAATRHVFKAVALVRSATLPGRV
jgi:hypothetical protein